MEIKKSKVGSKNQIRVRQLAKLKMQNTKYKGKIITDFKKYHEIYTNQF